VLIPDNTKATITQADPLGPRITPAFLEYPQARHFHIDPARSHMSFHVAELANASVAAPIG
jgi:hypothetical protein